MISGQTSLSVASAARHLAAGELVAFPTETVYGLGADASNPAAVRRIFEVKGRPSSHPLIVHLARASDLEGFARALTPAALRLAEKFWPGPLTLVVERSARVSPSVTGGQDSVALRVPNHPLALELLTEFGGGVAAPSANRFGAVSPTSAAHVRREFGDEVPHVLDGGACSVGLESTIVDVSRPEPVLLRPGGITAEEIETALGRTLARAVRSEVRVPGQLPSHYAPHAEVVLCADAESAARIAALRARGARVGLLAPAGAHGAQADVVTHVVGDARAYARTLYAELRAMDDAGVDVIVVVPPPALGVGLAVVDRLQRAAAPRPPRK